MPGELILRSLDGGVIRESIDNGDVRFIEDEQSDESLLVTIWEDGSFGIVQTVNTSLEENLPLTERYRNLLDPHELEYGPFHRQRFGYAGKIGRLTIKLINR
ncbi:MAG TPA: hypothetical protein VFH37_02770 [Candidatus Saccharimonadales bacterium]|nr:hypothetical protein [Candidatus Saccharimonadales bacterium]